MAKRRKPDRAHESPPEYLSRSQLAKLLQHVQHGADQARQKGAKRAVVDELIILLLVNAGLRAAELSSLNIADVAADDASSAVFVRDPRGRVKRTVDVDAKTAARLEKFVRLYRRGARPREPLIISERGKRLGYMSLYSKVRNIGRKAKIGRLHPHMLRRTYLLRLYELEKDLRLVQIQAGHASVTTTAKYVGANHQRPKPNAAATDDTRPSVAHPMHPQKDQSITAEQSAPTPGRPAQPGPSQSPPDIETCQACGREIPAAATTKIDSGQVLCEDCMTELRRR